MRTRQTSVLPRSTAVIPRSHQHGQPRIRYANTLGTAIHSHANIGLHLNDRLQHTHILGGTGKGKSKLLELLLREDIRNKNSGLILIDPHGSLYRDVVHYASQYYPKLAERCILFHPANQRGDIVGFNPIISETSNINFVVKSLVSAVLKISGQHDTRETPRISRWLTNIFSTLISNDLTLLESAPLISTAKQNLDRDLLMEKMSDQLILDDWSMYRSIPEREKLNYIEGAANRLRDLLSSDVIRAIIGQKSHSLSISEAMQQGKIILVNMNPSDVINRENTQLLGTLLVNEIYRCALNRDDNDPKLKPFYVYIDEFANFVTRDIASSLDETRKFKVFFTLAHQHLTQVKDKDEMLYSSIMTNCNNKIVFGGIDVDDAEIMARQLYTGYLDLKSVKDETYRTRERHHEETREVITNSTSTTEASNWSQSNSSSDTSQHSQSNNTSHGSSWKDYHYDDETRQKSASNGSGSSQSNSLSESEGQGGSISNSSAQSKAHVPFQRVEEVRELANRSYWNVGELMYKKIGELKNQGVAQITIKLGTDKPFQVNIKKVSKSYFSQLSTPKKIDSFYFTSQLANKNCCLTISEAEENYMSRQRDTFGYVLMNPELEPEPAYTQLISKQSGVFNDS